MKPSLRSIARALGVSLSALQEARDTGRVDLSEPIDVERIKQQWIASTNLQGPAPLAETAAPRDSSLADARRRKELAAAELKEIELRKMRGELIEVAGLTARLTDVFAACRGRVLALPVMLRQRLPHLSTADVGELESLIRETLEDLADGRPLVDAAKENHR